MDDESSYSQLVNISGEEREDEEAGNVKEGSLFYRKDKQCPYGCMDFVPPTLLQKITAEIISTFILVFVTCGSSILDHRSPPLVSELGGSVASGLIVMVMIYSVGHISGAHMNPAVTIAFATVRHFPWKQVPAYITAQLGGSIAACFALRVMLKAVSNTGITIPSGTVLQALAMEVVIGELAGIAVGSMVMISSIFAGPISEGSMNPARSLGPAIVSNNYKAIWVYLVGPIAGTVMGACSYSIIRLTDKPLQTISLRRASSFSSSKDGDSKSTVPNGLI